MDGYWGEGFLGQGEWNDHEHLGKEGVLGELGVSLWLIWNGVGQ
jgi:hypothetical protein